MQKRFPVLYLFLPLCLSVAGSFLSGQQTSFLGEGEWIDLTHEFSENTPYWPTADGFTLEVDYHGMTEGGWFYASNTFRTSEHGGTHLDAPIHFAEGKMTTDEIPIEKLVGPAAVIDVKTKALSNPDYLVTIADLVAWEELHGTIPEKAVLLLHTGYDRFWPDRVKYMGTDERGAQAVAKLHFPGLDPEAARWLTENRRVGAVGLDTPSIDFGQSSDFMSHRILFEHNIPVFENVARLSRLPALGSFVIALPMKIKGGSGGPLRIVAFVPEAQP